MALNKAILSGKEKREQYRRGKAVCKSCRNNGGCSWCEGNRKHKYAKEELKTKIND